jgi:uncharacterized protein DUF3631
MHPLEALLPMLDAGDGGLLGDVARFIQRYVVMTPAQLVATALWVVHTHAMEAAEQTPYLAITSPEKQCGKTRLMEVLELIVARPWRFELPSEAVLYRAVHAQMPTLLWDETDAVFNPRIADKYEGHRALINAGNRRGATVPRMAGMEKIVNFNVYSAKALAGIGTLPDTVADRSLPIRLQRRNQKTEPVESLRRREAEPTGLALRDRLSAWAKDCEKRLARARPEMPPELSDRMQDACEPLVAIAERMGQPWPALGRAALVELCVAERVDEVESMRIRLLRDLRTIFENREKATGRMVRGIRSTTLISELHRIEEAPWATYYGRGLEAKDLAALLRPYSVQSKPIKLKSGETQKGYRRDELFEAWERFLGPSG